MPQDNDHKPATSFADAVTEEEFRPFLHRLDKLGLLDEKTAPLTDFALGQVGRELRRQGMSSAEMASHFRKNQTQMVETIHRRVADAREKLAPSTEPTFVDTIKAEQRRRGLYSY